MTEKELERNFEIVVRAVLAGERCPATHPHGPLASGAIPALVRAGRIRSEVYALNFRRVTILTGPHAGKSTAHHPRGFQPWRIDGKRIEA